MTRLRNFRNRKAEEMDLELDDGIDNEYFRHIYKANDGTHTR